MFPSVTADQELGDPCKGKPFSFRRFAVLTLLFFGMWGGVALLILLESRPYGIQVSSMVIDTAAVALYTFSRNRGDNQPFLLSCPVVRRQLPRLIRRHLGFLAALFIFQSIALDLRPSLPAYWITPGSRDPSPFSVILGIVCAAIAIVQVFHNRSLLTSAHDLPESDYDS